MTKEYVTELTKSNAIKEGIIVRKSEETLEEESCICLEEGSEYQLRKFSFPLYYAEQEEYIPAEEVEEESEPEPEPEPGAGAGAVPKPTVDSEVFFIIIIICI